MAKTYAQHERESRKRRRAELKAIGRTPARRTFVYRVEPEIVAIPDWAFKEAVEGLRTTRSVAWLKDRKLAQIVAIMDRAEGGKPKLDRLQARRCQVCGALRVGQMAIARQRLDESAIDGRTLPCSPECTLRAMQKRDVHSQ